MKIILLFALLLTSAANSSVIGITNHPLSDEARVLSAELAGYMSQRQEMGMGLRYTQAIGEGQLLDFNLGGAQHSRGLTFGGGVDFELLPDEDSQPRVSIKPFYQHQKFDQTKLNTFGGAPALRKGFNINGQDFYPYLAVPMGIIVDSSSDEFDYFAQLSLGASAPLPIAGGDKLVASIEANKDLGASSDSVSGLISWIWK